jgi:hypothetical protein
MDDDLLAFLSIRDQPYCYRCLATAFPDRDVREQIERAVEEGLPILIGAGTCAICGLSKTVVAYITGDPNLLRRARGEER